MPKKIFFVVLFAFLLSASSYSQTWTVRDNENRRDLEYTVINREQFNRLLRQHETASEYCIMEYTDVLEMEIAENIISGSIPDFNGYYYIMVKLKPQNNKFTKEEQSALSMLNMTNGLIYGNSSTGNVSLIFTSMFGLMVPGAVEIDSDEYLKKFNQFIGFVNGE